MLYMRIEVEDAATGIQVQVERVPFLRADEAAEHARKVAEVVLAMRADPRRDDA